MAAWDDGLDIRSGGIVAVDTETLRAAARGLQSVAVACETIGATLARAARLLDHASVWIFPPGGDAADAAHRARRLAADLETMADTYEVVELAAQLRVAEAAGDADAANALRGRALVLLSLNPQILPALAAGTLRWRTETTRALADQYAIPGVVGLDVLTVSAAFTTLVALLGRGPVPQGTTLTGAAPPVSVTRIGGGRTTVPASLAQVVDRIPAGDGRVRVERYTMTDGSRRFMAYIAGTNPQGPDDEAWDAESNLDLYGRRQAASHSAVLAALADAGARPGDVVGLAGHSQGGMDASFVALSGRYDVPLILTFGDPVQAEVGDSALSVAVRHLDDPVSAFAGGGFAGGVGAAGSFVASREAPGTLLSGDGLLDQHALEAYRETARLLDASPDPRMDAVRARFFDLGAAQSVDVLVYGAARGAVPGAPVSASSAADAG